MCVFLPECEGDTEELRCPLGGEASEVYKRQMVTGTGHEARQPVQACACVCRLPFAAQAARQGAYEAPM